MRSSLKFVRRRVVRGRFVWFVREVVRGSLVVVGRGGSWVPSLCPPCVVVTLKEGEED